MTFAQRRNRLTTHFSERIPVVKRRMTTSSSRTATVHSVSYWHVWCTLHRHETFWTNT